MASLVRSSAASGSSTSQIQYSLILPKDYILDLPVIGSVNVQKMTYIQLRNFVTEEIKKKLPVDYLSFTLTTPGRFETFVGGHVSNPNVIIVTSVMRLHEAILKAGNFKETGSYRKIRLIHADGSEESIDLSKFITMGDDNNDPYLKQGDKIIVPAAMKMVKANSGFQTPGLYELVGDETLDNLIGFAGGLIREVDRSRVRIKRINASGTYSYIETPLEKDTKVELMDGDEITFYRASMNPSFVTVEAALYTGPNDGVSPITYPTMAFTIPFLNTIGTPSGGYSARAASMTIPTLLKANLPYYPGMNLHNLLTQYGGPTPYAMADQSVIYRKAPNTDFKFDVFYMWTHPEEAKKVELLPEDKVYIPMQDQFVVVTGQVNGSGAFPYMSSQWKVIDYLGMCGGIKPLGDKNEIFLMDRYGQKMKKVSVDYVVQPGDILYVDYNILQQMYDSFLTFLPVVSTISLTIYNIFLAINSFK